MKKTRILIADDDMDDRFLLETAFHETGNDETLQFVKNGDEVCDTLHAIENANRPLYPELIILDLNMPRKNGLEVLAEIKQHPHFKSIPVIVYTTTQNPSEIRKCYELGANTYIVKPVHFDTLCNVVKSIRNYWLGTATMPAA